MNYAKSQSFFEIPSQSLVGNTLRARLSCVKDFLRRLVFFPFALIYKATQTVFRAVGVGFGAFLVGITMGCSGTGREFFMKRLSFFAQDLGDWILMPFALIGCFFRLILALLIHPNIYFNGFSESV